MPARTAFPSPRLPSSIAAAGLLRRLEPAWSAHAHAALIGIAIVAGVGVVQVAQRLVVVVDHHPEQILLVRDLHRR